MSCIVRQVIREIIRELARLPSPTKWPMIRTLRQLARETMREMGRLPLLAKIGVGLIIPVIFVVVTQWERLPFTRPPILTPPADSLPVPTPAVQSNNFQVPPSDNKAETTGSSPALSNRLARFVIVDPQVHGNGLISGNGVSLYLHGLKPFDSKAVCTRASGERWACGLPAYATLRNAIAKQTITCDPKTLLPKAITATCRMGRDNIALALVREGLVELDDTRDDNDLLFAQAYAKSRRLGIWDR